MILIEENFNGIVSENSADHKKTYIRGVFMESESKNRNGRIYSRGDIEKAVTKVNEAAKIGRYILGELDHPSTLEVKLKNVSHKIVEMWMEGNVAMGKAEIIEDHPNGVIAKSLINSGITIGVSSRGSGAVNESNGRVSGFNFVTVDLVANPSALNAYPESIMEQLENAKNGGEIKSLSEAVLHDPIAQKYFQIEMKRFIETLRKR